MKKDIRLPMVLSALGLLACATARPVLYPNDHLRTVGQVAADQDIAECRSMAEAAGASRGSSAGGEAVKSTVGGAAAGAAAGAVGGAVVGSPGSGSAIGAASGATAGVLRSIFGRSGPDPVYVSFVNRCLQERGYEIVGWD
jgi:hypothetical protein